MTQNNKDFENEYDSYKDVLEWQNNMFNPGHYVGTGKVMPIISATGNALPLAIWCFIFSTLVLAFGLFLFFSDAYDTLSDKIIASIMMLAMSSIALIFGFRYLKKAKKYYKEKAKLENKPVDKKVKDKLWQRTCPQCGKSHDIDYPKCPHCKFNYNE